MANIPEGSHIVEPFLDKNGHPYVVLRGDDGRLKKLRVCEVMAMTFLGPCPDNFVIRHRDGNILNNALDNLFYGASDD